MKTSFSTFPVMFCVKHFCLKNITLEHVELCLHPELFDRSTLQSELKSPRWINNKMEKMPQNLKQYKCFWHNFCDVMEETEK